MCGRTYLAIAGLMLVAACANFTPWDTGKYPSAIRPTTEPSQPVAPPAYTPSASSNELKTYYARLQQDQLNRGLLRNDGGGPDTPFDRRLLVRNFVNVALYDEHPFADNVSISDPQPSSLRRWEIPVRIKLSFGNSVPTETRQSQTQFTQAYVARLARVTAHPISYTSQNANFHVLVLDEDERQAATAQFKRLLPNITDAAIRSILSMPRSTSCMVIANSRTEQSGYFGALAIIRAETPQTLWRSCLHEEVAQGLGPANDSPLARPSIFNDDEEFGFLTTHDELLLKILYDPRMRTGMKEATAEPTARIIATELMGDGTL